MKKLDHTYNDNTEYIYAFVLNVSAPVVSIKHT